jgi:hypothetical protein
MPQRTPPADRADTQFDINLATWYAYHMKEKRVPVKDKMMPEQLSDRMIKVTHRCPYETYRRVRVFCATNDKPIERFMIEAVEARLQALDA